jgi:outer membrane lipoprotein LolB
MLTLRYTFIASLLFLNACSPKPQLNEAMNNREAPPPPLAAESSSKLEKPLPNTPIETPLTNTVETNKKQTKVENSTASKINAWELSGAMAARTKSKGWSASVNWQQRGVNDYQIRLSGPIGSGTIMIKRSGGTVTLRDGPKTVTSANAESLLRNQTGMSLPVTKLFYWVRGEPAPGAVQGKKYDQAGRLIALRQAGYTIEYQRYSSYGQAILPSSIRLQGEGVSIKFVIKNWRI